MILRGSSRPSFLDLRTKLIISTPIKSIQTMYSSKQLKWATQSCCTTISVRLNWPKALKDGKAYDQSISIFNRGQSAGGSSILLCRHNDIYAILRAVLPNVPGRYVNTSYIRLCSISFQRRYRCPQIWRSSSCADLGFFNSVSWLFNIFWMSSMISISYRRIYKTLIYFQQLRINQHFCHTNIQTYIYHFWNLFRKIMFEFQHFYLGLKLAISSRIQGFLMNISWSPEILQTISCYWRNYATSSMMYKIRLLHFIGLQSTIRQFAVLPLFLDADFFILRLVIFYKFHRLQKSIYEFFELAYRRYRLSRSGNELTQLTSIYMKITEIFFLQLRVFYKRVIIQAFIRIKKYDFILIIMKQDKLYRIRKSLTAIKNTDERKGYFYCLKLLGVLPPPPNSGFQKWQYYTPISAYSPIPQHKNQLYTPKCLHDVLIASHSTSCEHGSFYFAYYHRNLMILTELFLNFAHQVLLGGQQRLKSVYSESQFPFLYNEQNKPLWDSVFTVYKNLKGIPDQIANHYWNPTNYLNDQDLTVLEELAPKEKSDDPIDVLFLNINKSYPWEIHVPRRWYNTPDQYDIKDLGTGQGDDINFFHKDDVPYTPDQQKFVRGELDPRLEDSVKVYGNDMSFIIKEIAPKKFTGWINDNGNQVLHRNYTNYHDSEDKRNYAVNSIPADELLSNYGAKSKNLQYISIDKKPDIITSDLKSSYIFNYNQLIPHYLLAAALWKKDITSFFWNKAQGIQAAHNIMHNNFQFMMNDGSFSLTSLIFFPYHSWLDCELQIRIRMANGKDNNNDQPNTISHTLTNNINALPGRFQNIIELIQGLFKKQLNWNISGDPLIINKVGAYPICEYISPYLIKPESLYMSLKPLEVAFCARDYIMAQQKLRTSFELNEIYQEYYINKLNTKRFWFLKDIKKYIFDYNYQFGPDSWSQLNLKATNLPQYLKDMEKIWQPSKTANDKAIQAATTLSVKSKGIKFNYDKGKDKDKEIKKYRINQTLKVRKLFQSGLHLFASYAPNTKNRYYPILLKYKKVISKIYNKLSQKELDQLEQYISSGHLVGYINTFGKENSSEICPKCSNNKIILIDLDQKLRVRLPKLWQSLHVASLNQVLFDSQKPDLKLKCISQNIQLVPNGTFNDYRLVYGAEEIEVSIIDSTTGTGDESQYIRLDAQSYSISKNVIHNVLSKKFYTFTQTLDFYKIFDVSNQNKNNRFDSYVYKRLKGFIYFGPNKIDFSIDIPCFQRFLRLKVQISGNVDSFKVVVTDADFEPKKKYYHKAVQKDQ